MRRIRVALIAIAIAAVASSRAPGAEPAGAGGEQAAATTPAAGFDQATLRRLEAALARVNLSVADLSWDKRPISDGFRLSCVDETLDRPLALAERAARAEREFGSDPLASARAAASWLDTEAGEEGLPDLDPSLFPGAPPDAARLLAVLVSAWEQADQLRRESEIGLTRREETLLREAGASLYLVEWEADEAAPLLAIASKVNVARLVQAEIVLAEAAARVSDEAPGLDASGWPSLQWNVRGLRVALGGPGPDRHAADVILDGGGEDTYTGGSVILDLAGDDVYREAGSGFGRVALVVDLAGNDLYRGSTFVSGGTAFGASLSFDAAGDDVYDAGQLSQGAAFFGVGMLFDLAGNDAYRGARYVQGFGGIRGLGVLSDAAGNDSYYAGGTYDHAPLAPENYQSLSQGFGFGLRDASASGGVGILADHGGNDVYAAEIFGQGASYWFSLGVLVDTAGHDKYNLYQYGQGAGIHLSSGVLLDRAGNDGYTCNNGVAQGSGHDWGVGLLWDLAGDDAYQGSGMSQGGANANGIGLLVDRSGNDSYAGWNVKNQGDSFFSRGTIGLGVLLDLGGTDRYTHGGRDGLVWTNGTVGVGSDTAEGAGPPPEADGTAAALSKPARGASAPAQRASGAAAPPAAPSRAAGRTNGSAAKGPSRTAAPVLSEEDTARLDALWDDACLWEVGANVEKVGAARTAMIAEGTKALDYLIPGKLSTKDTLVTRSLTLVLTGIGKEAVPRLIPVLHAEHPDARRNAAELLGALGAVEAAPAIAGLLDDADARLGALSALGALKTPDAVPRIVALMNSDAPERARFTAAATLGAIGGTSAEAALAAALGSSVAPIRFAAQYALEAAKAVPTLRSLLKSPDLRVRLHAIAALGHVVDLDAAGALRPLLSDPSPLVRGFAAEALGAVATAEDRAALRDRLAAEGDPFVRGKLEAALRPKSTP